MRNLCYQCNYLNADKCCSICSEQEQRDCNDMGVRNFAAIKRHSVTIESKRYYLRRR